MKTLITIAALLAFTTGAHAETKCRASFNAYKVIQTGMSYAKVVELVGCEGAEQSESEGGGAKVTMYSWDGEPKGEMSVMFINGKLSNKSKIGLESYGASSKVIVAPEKPTGKKATVPETFEYMKKHNLSPNEVCGSTARADHIAYCLRGGL